MRGIPKTIFAAALPLLLFTGCAQSSSEPAAAAVPENSLLIYTAWPVYYADNEMRGVFEQLLARHVAPAFPHVQLVHIDWDDMRYEQLLASGLTPDLIIDDTSRNFNEYILGSGLEYDLTKLTGQAKDLMGTLNPQALAKTANLSSDGALYGLPFQINDHILYYNQTIFDRFGAPYPANGITYDEAYELAKKLTRADGAVTYKGYVQHASHYSSYNPYSLDPLHVSEDRADLSASVWTKLVDNLKRFYEIPYNRFESPDRFSLGRIAMSVTGTDRLLTFPEENPQLRFDITAPPMLGELPEIRYQPNVLAMYLTSRSEKKELAFEVMKYMLSEPFQIEMAKEGIVTPVQTEAVQKAYGTNLPSVEGKNTSAIFYGQYAPPASARKSGLTYHQVNTQYTYYPLILDEGKDTLTALKLTEDKANEEIAQKKASQSND